MTTTNGSDGGPLRSASAKAAEAFALAEAAEAEAEAAEARAVAARARVRALELRRLADTADTAVPDTTDLPEAADTPREAVTANAGHTTEEVDSTDTEDIADAPAAEQRSRRPRGKRTVLGAALAVVIIAALLGASGYMTVKHRSAARERHRSAEFAAAARQGVVSLTSMNFQTAQQDVQRVLDNSTGQFKDDFQARAGDFTKVVQQSKVVTTGTVNAAAVESMTDNSAEVLVAATSEVTNAAGAKQEPRAWRLSVSVTDDGGQLKMSKVEFVP